MKTSLDILKSWFQTGDTPTENQFENLIDSFHHKDDGNIITSYEILTNGDVSFTFSDGNTTSIEKFVLPNTMPQNFIDGLVETLNSKVTKETGKQLSDENFTLELKQKLVELENYVHPEFHEITDVKGLQAAIESKVDTVDGKQLSDENFSFEEKEKLANLENYVAPDSQPISYIEELEESLSKINQDLENKIDIVEGKQLSDENFTTEEKEKLANFNISTFSTVTDGENRIIANGQADELVFDGVTIDIDKNIISIDQPEIPTSYPISSIENLQDELDSINTSLADKVDSTDLQNELDQIKEDINNKVDNENLSTEVEKIEGNLEEKVDRGDFTLLEDKVQELESNFDDKLNITEFTPVKDQVNEIKSNLDDKLNVSEFTPTKDKVSQIETNLEDKLDTTEFTPVKNKINEVEAKLVNKVDKIVGKQLSSNDYTDKEKEKLANLNLNSFSTITDGVNTISASKEGDQVIFKGATINPGNNSIEIDSSDSQNIFPEFNFSWGDKSKSYTKSYSNTPTRTYTGNVNLLDCELINGSDNILDYEPKILLYRYKSKKKITYYDKKTNKPFLFTKKARFYHYEDSGRRNTVIPITSRKSTLDFGLEHFFKDDISTTSSRLLAMGMKNGNQNTLYRKKSRSQAHFYIKVRLQLTYKGKTILSPFSETLRVFIDKHEQYKISFERT
ncbi:hypothetical protein [uncultured Tenacibaculum sp.]|uniref:hypothetical protein n=1 Tax=uncultured Tenacibaculum sp. TaxID=174713 RepID=UPI00262DA3A9|nr:hypothetical protein [uncultured Tenacibaculum sp.]